MPHGQVVPHPRRQHAAGQFHHRPPTTAVFTAASVAASVVTASVVTASVVTAAGVTGV